MDSVKCAIPNYLKCNLKLAHKGPDPCRDFDLCMILTPFAECGRPEQLLLYKEASSLTRYLSAGFCYFQFCLSFALMQQVQLLLLYGYLYRK